jgi:phosphodiesterase/alkaline phosphatase D-like protein
MLPAASRFAIIVFISTATLILLASACGSEEPVEFTHGVASGDVTSEGAVLWTRTNRGADLTAEVSTTESFAEIAVEQEVEASGDADNTAKAEVAGLQPATQYYYRFTSGDETSLIGAFLTAPASDQEAAVRFVFSGDSDGTVSEDGTRQYDFGVLDAARQENADFFVYLGDTIDANSEQAEPATGSTSIGRSTRRTARSSPCSTCSPRLRRSRCGTMLKSRATSRARQSTTRRWPTAGRHSGNTCR